MGGAGGPFAAQVERAGYGLAHTPIFEDVRVFRRGIGEGSDVVGKEMYEFEDRGGRTLALRPEGTAPMVRAFVQHRPPLPWKAWYATPAFRYERPQAGRYRQHHQLGVEALGPADPDLDVEVVSLADGFFRSLGLAAFDLRLNSMGDEVCRPGLPRAAAGLPGRAPGPAVPRAPRAARRPTRSGSSTASGRSAWRPPPTPPHLVDHLCDPCRAALRPGARPAWTRSACPTCSTTGWSGASTTTPGPPSSSRRRPWSRPRTGSAAAAATTAWWRCWAARRPRGSASASASSGCCWPATPKGSSRSTRRRSTPSWSTWPAGEAARDLTAELRRAGLRADRAFDGRSMKSQLKSADRSGARVALIVGPDEVAAGTVSLRPLRGDGDQRTGAGAARWWTRCGPRPPVAGPAVDPPPYCVRGPRDRARHPKGPS